MDEEREREVAGQPRDFDVRFETTPDGDTTVAVTGEVDLYTAPRLREQLDEAIESGSQRLIVDLSELDFIDSTGLGVLVGALKRARQGGGELTLRSPTRSTYKILEIAGLTKLFTIE
jgi:anti-sigma B factor antagonist